MAASHGPKSSPTWGSNGLTITMVTVTRSYYAPENLLTTRTGFIGALQPTIWLSTFNTRDIATQIENGPIITKLGGKFYLMILKTSVKSRVIRLAESGPLLTITFAVGILSNLMVVL